YNADLANNVGNLLSRTLNMAWKYSGGRVNEPIVRNEEKNAPGWVGDVVQNHVKNYERFMATHAVDAAFGEVIIIATHCNILVEASAPWKMAKDRNKGKDVETILYVLVESLRIVAILISLVLPKAAHGIFDQLNWKMDLSGREERFSLKDAQWGGLPNGHVIGKPVPLFPR